MGTDDAELARLRDQHATWAQHADQLWRAAGIGSGAEVLDLGCGPGFTTRALADLVGMDGRVVGRDMSARFLTHLDERRRLQGYPQIESSIGDVEEHDDELGAFDFVYARWVFCWLDDPAAAFAASARYLKPGGALVLQEYLDWGSMRLMPHSTPFERAVGACMQSFDKGPGTIDIARSFPDAAGAHGLGLEHFAPIARVGAVGSPEWRWIGAFFHSYVPRLVELDFITEQEVDEMRAAWSASEREGTAYLYTPVMADAVFRRPLEPAP